MGRLSFFLVIALFILPWRGAAEEPAAPDESSFLERIDSSFGTYFVAPMAEVMFWDVVFWDNTLPKGEGIGEVVGDEEVVGFEGDAYILKRRFDAPTNSVTLDLKERGLVTYGAVKGKLSRSAGQLFINIEPGPVKIRPQDIAHLLPFASAEGQFGVTVSDGSVSAESLFITKLVAPFPVVLRADGAEGVYQAVRASAPISPSLVQIEVGDRVQVKGGGSAIVQATKGNSLGLVSTQTRQDADLKLANPTNTNMPLVVIWLVFGSIFFTLRMQFINLRGFWHAIQVTAGKYDDEHQEGEITHFQALASALSATVGLGNIAGVALAVAAGGPGAIFWMIIAGFLGMSSKFVECTLGQMHRIVDAKGNVRGGPMEYLPRGLKEKGMGGLGKVLGFFFTIMCIGGSFGGGNMFQANQSYQAVAEVIPWFQDHAMVYGVVLALAVGAVIIGGVKRIGAAASLIVPLMCGIYVLAGLWILLVHADQLPMALGKIVGEAFTPQAGMGGFIGVLVQGFRRAAFSNEAGVGSASIAHSAAATDEPVREGIVALLEPFIDTIIVCTMTGLVVVITGAYESGAGDGVLMTSAAFGSVISWFPKVLSIAVVLFAFSTMISWSYYGERCFTSLFGDGSSMVYRVIFLFFVVFGSVIKLGNVLDFSDLMILGMAFPNILGAVLLSGSVRERLMDYWERYQSGAMEPKS